MKFQPQVREAIIQVKYMINQNIKKNLQTPKAFQEEPLAKVILLQADLVKINYSCMRTLYLYLYLI